MPPEIAWPETTLRATFLYEAFAALDVPLDLDATPEGRRVLYTVTGGRVAGPRLNGRFVVSGGDWGRFRPDGSFALDVRACLETDDGATIYVTYQGRLVVAPDLQAAVFDMAAATRPAPDSYYFRVAPFFETAHPDYAWLNGIVAIGVGQIVQGGVAYRIYAID